jgi:hypothetical protein
MPGYEVVAEQIAKLITELELSPGLSHTDVR